MAKGVWIVTFDHAPHGAYDKMISTVGVFNSFPAVLRATPRIKWHELRHTNGTIFENHWYGDANDDTTVDMAHYTADFFPLNEIGEWFRTYMDGDWQRPK